MVDYFCARKRNIFHPDETHCPPTNIDHSRNKEGGHIQHCFHDTNFTATYVTGKSSWGQTASPHPPRSSSHPNMLAVTPAVFVFFLHLHPAVLKPDFHLSLGQTQQSGYLVPTIPWEVHVKQKLLFQFEDLVLCIGATLFSGGLRVKPVGRRVIWRQGGRVGG